VSEFPSGCLGKLPLHGDFIRYNAAGAEVQELDQWVQDGIYECYSELASGWDGSFDSAPKSRFIYCSPRSGRIVAGLFKPSVDKAGRRYPFMVYTVVEPGALGNEVSYLPSAMDGFLARAEETLEWSASAINLNTFLSTFEGLRFEPDMVEARKQFAMFVLSRAAGDYWGGSFGDAEDVRKFAAVGAVVEGAGTRPPGVLAMRLPLCDAQAEAAFWLELSRRLSDGKGLPTLTFWNEPTADVPARLHMAWGELSPRYFLAFVLPTRGSFSVRDLTNRDSLDGRWVEYGRARFGEVLSDASLKLSDLLQRLPRTQA